MESHLILETALLDVADLGVIGTDRGEVGDDLLRVLRFAGAGLAPDQRF